VRRDLADKFLGILSWHEDIETAVDLAKEAKARKKRLRREARRLARKAAKKDALDKFFRTEVEAKYDEQPAIPREPQPYFVKEPAPKPLEKEVPPRNDKRPKRKYPKVKS
jgi:hypothetical protein